MNQNPLIELKNLSYAYGGHTVLRDITLTIDKGDTVAIIGKNGAGKSTLLKCIAGYLPSAAGEVALSGRAIGDVSPRKRAAFMAYVPQLQGRLLPFTVYEYVMLGRYPYQNFLALPREEDKKIVMESLQITDTADFARRGMNSLSGGELQRVFLAGAVSQRARILLLDEPATFLDPKHQETIQRVLERIHAEFGTTVLTVTHDVNLALGRYAKVFVLTEGACFFYGKAEELSAQSPQILERVFDIPFDAAKIKDRQPIFIPRRITP
ncbi:MAG: ABC transporter ATP-binding protein [Chitinivibrionales bacterium]|nr:ABC transporter ATP-binding protein [Chitinivibrionales bacterium]